jgi:hypothetical protein
MGMASLQLEEAANRDGGFVLDADRHLQISSASSGSFHLRTEALQNDVGLMAWEFRWVSTRNQTALGLDRPGHAGALV